MCHSVYDDNGRCQGNKKQTRVRLSAVTRQRAGGTWLPANEHNLRAFPFIRRVLLLLFSAFAHDRELATFLNHSLSFHQPCIRSSTTTMIVSANSHLAPFSSHAAGLFTSTPTPTPPA